MLDQEHPDDRIIGAQPQLCVLRESVHPYQKTLPMANPRPMIMVSPGRYARRPGQAEVTPCSTSANLRLTKCDTQVKDEVSAENLHPKQSAPSCLRQARLIRPGLRPARPGARRSNGGRNRDVRQQLV